MKKKVSGNALFVVIFLVMTVAIIKKNQSIDIDTITEPDAQLVFSTESVLEQTWQSNVKRISEIVMPYFSDESFEGEIELQFMSDDGEQILASSKQDRKFDEGGNGSLTFRFEPLRVALGTRYLIRIHYINYSDAGSLLLPANSNYGGCCINGKDVGQAIGLTIKGTKTNSVSFLVIVCLPFFSFSFLFMMIWKRKWEETIGMSFILTTLIMVFAGICGILHESIYFIYTLSIVSMLVGVWLYNRNKLQLKDLFSPGLIVFFVFIIFVIVNCMRLYISRADEFSFWGLAVKDMYYYDSLTKHADTVVLHTYYPPFMLCIEYFFVYINAFFSDRIVYIGCQLMLVSCLVVSCKDAVKRPKAVVLSIVTFFIAPLLFYEDIFSTLYADASLAVFVAYVLICYFTEEMSAFNLVRIIGGLAALTFTKPTGVVLAGLITLVILCDIFLAQKERQEYSIKKLLTPCFLTLAVCCLYFIWQAYLKAPIRTSNLELSTAVGIAESQPIRTITSESGMTIENITSFLMLRGKEYQYDVLKIFINSMLVGDLFTIGNISFSYFELLLLLFLLIWLFAKGLPADNKRKILRFGRLNCLAGVGYSIFLLATYLFSFSEKEAVGLAHIPRYLASWLCGVFLAFLVLVISAIADKEGERHRNASICIFLIMLLVFIAPTGKLTDRRVSRTNMEQYAYGYEKTAEAARSFGDKAEQIYFVGEGIDNRHMFAYALCPMRVSFTSEAPELSKWKEELVEYQYVFLLNVDHVFKNRYMELFADPTEIKDASFYKVVINNNDIVLQYIGTTKAMQKRE